MKRTVFAWTIAMLLIAAPALAQRGGGSSKPPHASQPKPTTTGAPKVQGSHGSAGSMKGGGATKTTTKPVKTTAKPVKTTAKPTKTSTASSMKPAKTKATTSASAGTTKSTGGGKKTSTSSTSVPPTTTTTTTTTTGSTTTLTPVQQKLQKNTNLASKLQSRLPAGTDLMLASEGFRNLGQFVAAVNVSNNLGIAFTDLKTRMVDQGMSLGQAIQDARPTTTNTTTVVTRAENDADSLIRETESTSTKTAKTAKPKKPKALSSSGGQR